MIRSPEENTTERQAFEKWWKEKSGWYQPDIDTEISGSESVLAWDAWQARAQMEADFIAGCLA